MAEDGDPAPRSTGRCEGLRASILVRTRDGAELLHHAHHVPVGPALHDLALRAAVYGYPGPGKLSVGGLNAHERAPVSPHGRETRGYHISFGQLDVDGVVEVGEGLAELFGEGLHRLHSVQIAG